MIVLPGGLLFGEVADVVPGYLMITGRELFVKARKDKADYFVCDRGDRWELWPCAYDGEKTPTNPLGEYVAYCLKPVVVPKP